MHACRPARATVFKLTAHRARARDATRGRGGRSARPERNDSEAQLAIAQTLMRIEGDWARDGILIARELFDQPRVARLLAVSEELLEQYRTLNPIDGQPGPPSATSLFQIHHPGFFGAGSPKLREILEAVADPNVLRLVCDTCKTHDPIFSHTSIFFNPIEPRPPDSLGAGLPGSSACCGEWHRDAQYIHPDEEKEKALILRPDAVVGGQMMQIQCALLPSQHFEYVRGSHNRWDTPDELLVRKGGQSREYRFSDDMPGATRDLLNPGDALVFCPWVIHRGHCES